MEYLQERAHLTQTKAESKMWAVSLIPPTPLFSKPTKPLYRPHVVTLPRSGAAPPQNGGDDGEFIGGVPRREKQLSGSDVLRALQRAAAQKNKKSRKRRELSSAGSDKEDDSDDVDFSNVKPLCVKREWAVKLNELEKRLQQLSEIN